MTAQIETANAATNPTRWRRLLAWLTALEQAMDYDPQEHTDASVKHLREEVRRLAARLRDVERLAT